MGGIADNGYTAPRRLGCTGMSGSMIGNLNGVRRSPAPTLEQPESRATHPDTTRAAKYAHLSREDLELAVEYWEPRALALTTQNDQLKTEKHRYERMGFVARLRWVFRSKSNGAGRKRR